MEENTNQNEQVEVKQETIMDTANTKDTKRDKKKPGKTRMIVVILFLILLIVGNYIQLRGSYLEYMELGESYVEVLKTNLIYRYIIMGVNFVFLYFVFYFTNRGIRKGLKVFFDQEKKEMPKLPNKSLALVFSAIISIIISSMFMEQIMLMINSTSFGITDPMFNLDISYYIFQKPMIETMIFYMIGIFVGLSIYTALYYVVAFNRFFDGVDGKMLKTSLFMRKLMRNILGVIIGIGLLTILNTQNTMFGNLITIEIGRAHV